ncbi:Hpr(Ser) kinase/phosphatase [Natranaerovirga hydrolytica]|uniref:HPr kinase/phosphorylase n=1 Tax=Natranaerovirga hydrolytica TaxID=680378 RepID=A0A4R1MNF8_9FIRM|nr:HPr(Ser) kinase/phosphatase [Natranaerovirga hydrolytica]TCK93482.1 Hpr(Ser) kinase/phosphatase [Natranaerovirga hydrolytica]
MYTVGLTKIVERMELKNLTPNISIEDININQSDINRPALQLAGFFDYFDSERVQIIGKVEYTYLEKMSEKYRFQVIEALFQSKIPCLIFCKGLEPTEDIMTLARKHNIPVLSTEKTTSSFMAELIRYLKVELAPRMSIHGVLVDVYGEGVLIMGESGIGKSEAALELIKRGHRLVADDVVEIKKVSDDELVGTCPDIIRYLIELRGIGIIDCKTLFGVESVKETQNINLVIKLEEWDKSKEYDRLGLEDEYIEFLGNKIICQSIPIRPGRNLAVIVESAAVNHRQKQMGYNAALEFNNRVMSNLESKKKSNEAKK